MLYDLLVFNLLAACKIVNTINTLREEDNAGLSNKEKNFMLLQSDPRGPSA